MDDTPEKKRGKQPEDDRVTMPLSAQAHRLLLKRRAEGWENEYIFPGKHPSPYISDMANYIEATEQNDGARPNDVEEPDEWAVIGMRSAIGEVAHALKYCGWGFEAAHLH